MQVLTTLRSAGPFDSVSCKLLTKAFRLAARPGSPARLPAFAGLSRDLLKHASHTLPPNPDSRSRAASPTRYGPSNSCIPTVRSPPPSLPGDLLTAADDLCKCARLPSRATVTNRHRAARFLNEALSTLQTLPALLDSYLEHAFQPLEPLVTRQGVRTFISQTA